MISFNEEASQSNIDWIIKLFKQEQHQSKNEKFVNELKDYLKIKAEKVIRNNLQNMQESDFTFYLKIKNFFIKNHQIYSDYDQFTKSLTKYEFEKIFKLTYQDFSENNSSNIKTIFRKIIDKFDYWNDFHKYPQFSPILNLFCNSKILSYLYEYYANAPFEESYLIWSIFMIIHFFSKNVPKYVNLNINFIDDYELFVLFLTEIFMNSKLKQN